MTRGTEGYSGGIERFAKATLELSFEDLHEPFLQWLPARGSRVLDVGAGVGRDALALHDRGYTVTAVEPEDALRARGQALHAGPGVEWVADSLPELAGLSDRRESFDFVLASAVWHHLDGQEQQRAMERIAALLRTGGVFAVSLRHGPPGLGTCVFPTDADEMVGWGRTHGLTDVLRLDRQPSLLPGKPDVSWSRLAFRKPAD